MNTTRLEATMMVDGRERAYATSARSRQQDERSFRLIALLCLPLFLLVAMAARVVPARWQPARPECATRRSVFAEAWEAAHSTIAIAFSD